MPFVGREWWLESVGCGLLRSHIAELSVRFARLAGGSAIAGVDVSGEWIERGVEVGVLTPSRSRRRDGRTIDRDVLALPSDRLGAEGRPKYCIFGLLSPSKNEFKIARTKNVSSNSEN